MTAFKRWQDWCVMLAGACLIAAPYVFSETSDTTVLWATGLIGAAMILLGLFAGAARKADAREWLPAVAGAVAFAAPWLFSYTDMTSTAWASWVVGIVAVLAAGEVSYEGNVGHSPQHI